MDIALAIFCGMLSIIAWYREPLALGLFALTVLLSIGGLRIWIDFATTKNLARMKKGLDRATLDKIHARITKKRRKLGATLMEYATEGGTDRA